MALTIFNLSNFTKKLIFSMVSVFLLFFDFYSNTWRVAEPNWFQNNLRDSESLVIGRMVKSRQDGIFSAGGLTGFGFPCSTPWGYPGNLFEYQYKSYIEGNSFGSYVPYYSQIGGQGIVFSFLDKVIPLASQSKLSLFHMFTSLLTATTLTLIALWFYLEFSLLVAVFVLIPMVVSQWLVVFGQNLWWCLWSFYVPMVTVMYFLRYDRTLTKSPAIRFICLIFFGVLAKVFFTGYEYLTTTLIMMMVPLVFYYVLDQRGRRWLSRYTLLAIFASGLAIVLSMVVLCFQVAAIKGSLLNGVHYIIHSLKKRTYAKTPIWHREYSASLTSLTQMLWIYLKGPFFDLPNYFNVQNPFLIKAFLKVRYPYLILIFWVASWLLRRKRTWADSGIDGRRSKALVVSTWFSILAPLSWFLIFKQHSAIHTHMNLIVWQMPFTIFGFALCGLAVNVFLPSLFRQTIRHT